MRELTYFVAVSLDGFIAAPDGAFDAFPTHGDHIDWIVREYPETLPTMVRRAVGIDDAPAGRFDTVLMGWNTYAAGFPVGVTDPYRHLRQYVFSRTRHEADGDIVVTGRDPVAVARELKAEPGDAGIWLCGGGRLAGALVDEIDRLVLKVNPLLLGSGVPLLAGRGYDPRALTLASSRRFDTGVVVNEYARG